MGNSQCCAANAEVKRELVDNMDRYHLEQDIKDCMDRSEWELYNIYFTIDNCVQLQRSGIQLFRRQKSNILYLIQLTFQEFHIEIKQNQKFEKEEQSVEEYIRNALELIFSNEQIQNFFMERIDDSQKDYSIPGNRKFISQQYMSKKIDVNEQDYQSRQSIHLPMQAKSQHQINDRTNSYSVSPERIQENQNYSSQNLVPAQQAEYIIQSQYNPQLNQSSPERIQSQHIDQQVQGMIENQNQNPNVTQQIPIDRLLANPKNSQNDFLHLKNQHISGIQENKRQKIEQIQQSAIERQLADPKQIERIAYSLIHSSNNFGEANDTQVNEQQLLFNSQNNQNKQKDIQESIDIVNQQRKCTFSIEQSIKVQEFQNQKESLEKEKSIFQQQQNELQLQQQEIKKQHEQLLEQKKQLNEKSQLVDQVQHQIDEQKEQIDQQYESLKQQQSSQIEQQNQIKQQQNLITQKHDQILQQQQFLSQKQQLLDEKQQYVDQKEQQLEQQQQQILISQKQNQEIQNQIKMKEINQLNISQKQNTQLQQTSQQQQQISHPQQQISHPQQQITHSQQQINHSQSKINQHQQQQNISQQYQQSQRPSNIIQQSQSPQKQQQNSQILILNQIIQSNKQNQIQNSQNQLNQRNQKIEQQLEQSNILIQQQNDLQGNQIFKSDVPSSDQKIKISQINNRTQNLNQFQYKVTDSLFGQANPLETNSVIYQNQSVQLSTSNNHTANFNSQAQPLSSKRIQSLQISSQKQGQNDQGFLFNINNTASSVYHTPERKQTFSYNLVQSNQVMNQTPFNPFIDKNDNPQNQQSPNIYQQEKQEEINQSQFQKNNNLIDISSFNQIAQINMNEFNRQSPEINKFRDNQTTINISQSPENFQQQKERQINTDANGKQVQFPLMEQIKAERDSVNHYKDYRNSEKHTNLYDPNKSPGDYYQISNSQFGSQNNASFSPQKSQNNLQQNQVQQQQQLNISPPKQTSQIKGPIFIENQDYNPERDGMQQRTKYFSKNNSQIQDKDTYNKESERSQTFKRTKSPSNGHSENQIISSTRLAYNNQVKIQ